MDFCSNLINQDTRTFSETHCEDIVLQNYQDNFDSIRKDIYPETDHQFDTICEESHCQKPETSQAQENQEPGFRDNFKTLEEPNFPTTLSPKHLSKSLSLSPTPQPNIKPQPTKYLSKKKELQLKSQEYQRNFKHQQKLFALCFQYMNQEVANKIAEESGIATEAFIKRKRHAEKNNRMIEQFMEMMDCESTSSWSSLSGRKRRNWFRRVSRKDVKTVMEWLKGVEKEVEVFKVKVQESDDQEIGQKESDSNLVDIKNTPEYQKDIIEHLKEHSLFIENLPPRITYSQLEKYLQTYGDISHFLILDFIGRRKTNDPVPTQTKSNSYRNNKFQQQSKIIGFVEFNSVKPVEAMLNDMKEKKLRYHVKTIDTINENEEEKEKEPEQPLRKTSEDSESLTIQQGEQKKKINGSRKIYVRQVDWEQMLKPHERTTRESWVNKRQQKQKTQSPYAKDQPLTENDSSSVTQTPHNSQTTQKPGVIYEGWQQKNEQSREQKQKKQKSLDKLNMLRLKLRLIKSTSVVKEEPPEITQGEKQIIQEEQRVNEEDLKPNIKQAINQESVQSNYEGPIPIIQELPLGQVQAHDKQEQQGNNNNYSDVQTKSSQPTQTEQTQTTINCTQTDCPNVFSPRSSPQQNPIPQMARRCQGCESREKSANRRSIEKQIHITVGVKFSSQVPIKSSLGTFYFEERTVNVEEKQLQQIVTNATKQNNVAFGDVENQVANKNTQSVQIVVEGVRNEPVDIVLQNRSQKPVNQCRQSNEQAQQPIRLETQVARTIEQISQQGSPLSQQKHKAYSQSSSSSDQKNQIHSSSSSIYSQSQSIRESDQKADTKPKSFFEYSLWESDQDGNGNATKNQSKNSSNPLSIDRKLRVNERIIQNGLSDSPIINHERHQEGEIFANEHKDKKGLSNKEDTQPIKGAQRKSHNSSQSQQSHTYSSWSSSSQSRSKEKEKSFQSRTNQNSQNTSRRHDQSNRQGRYNRDQNNNHKREGQTNYRNNNRDQGNQRKRFDREDSYRGRNDRAQNEFRGDTRYSKFSDRLDRTYEKNSTFPERQQRKANYDRDYGNSYKRNDTRQSSRKKSDYDDKAISNRNFYPKRSEQERKSQFPGQRTNRRQDNVGAKRYQEKEPSSKKWKYSEYVEEEKSSGKKKQIVNNDEDWNY